MSAAEIVKNEPLAHLMGTLSKGEEIGHYGQLVFAMVG